MKYTLIFLLSFLFIACQNNPGTSQKESEVPVYHIKVVPYGDITPGVYVIHFTNNDWKTSEDLYETIEGTDIWQSKLFTGNCEDAVAFARQFTTYQSCVDNNTTTYLEAKKVRDYNKLHPEPPLPPPSCNINTNIY